MKNERHYLRCEICGNVIGMIEDSGVPMECCGQEMTPLVPNTVDAAAEKHVPAIDFVGDLLKVRIGEVKHPATAGHHIVWIAVAQGARTQRVVIEVGAPPKADFVVDDGEFTVYAYCNLHGLWALEN